MPLDENAALRITAVRAVESAPALDEVWTDADRAWASRAAAEIVGEGAASDAFLIARARLALERIGERGAAFPRVVRALRWRSWIGGAILAGAFVAGLALDQVGGTQRINLLAPPLFAVIAWNVIVYALLAIGFLARRRDAPHAGPIRRLTMRWAAGRTTLRRTAWGPAIADLSERWSRQSRRLYVARAARVLHLAAMTFAVGLLCGLYARGLAFEYRATWESTFLGPERVHALLASILAPGAAISGVAVPGLAEVEAIRAPGSENAARWLHLIAATVVLVVVVPRLMLACWAWMVERYRARHLPLALDEPYFARLLHGFRGAPARVQIVPYSYALSPAESAGLERIVRRVFGPNASVTIHTPVAYGGEDALGGGVAPAESSNVIGLFNATATPEREAHGAFLDALQRHATPGGAVIALVDESAWRERWGDEAARLRDRRASWTTLCADRQVPCVFATLRAPDLADAASGLERAVEGAGR